MQKAVDRTVNSAIQQAGEGLGRCLVDGDATLASRERRRRSKAFGFSILIETAALALLVIAPLVTSVAKPVFKQPEFTPIAFGKASTPIASHNHNNPPHHPGILTGILVPGRPPARPPQEEPEGGGENPGSTFNSEQSEFNPILFSAVRAIEPSPVVEPKKSDLNRPLKVSSTIIEARLISRVEPRYPQLAVITKREGTVVLHAIISRDGRIDFLEVVSGPPLLVPAALDAVRQWRYRPTLLNGEPVEVETSITVNFRLHAE